MRKSRKEKAIRAVFLLTLLIMVGCARKEVFPPAEESSLGTPKTIVRPITTAFKGGERITLGFKYLGIIPIAKATVEVKEKIYQGREVYYLLVEIKSSPFFSAFYKIEDKIESYLDARRLHTLRFEEHLREGRHFMEKVTTYDQKNHLAEFTNKVTKRVKKVKVPVDVQDPLSALYYLRAQKFEDGKTFTFDVNNHKKNFQTGLKILRKEEIKIPSGTFTAWVAEPAIKRYGVRQMGRGTVWFSADERKIPLLLKAKTPIGPVTAYLMSIK